jgi:hypothetical protein
MLMQPPSPQAHTLQIPSQQLGPSPNEVIRSATASKTTDGNPCLGVISKRDDSHMTNSFMQACTNTDSKGNIFFTESISFASLLYSPIIETYLLSEHRKRAVFYKNRPLGGVDKKE